jgi:hypothetical protein
MPCTVVIQVWVSLLRCLICPYVSLQGLVSCGPIGNQMILKKFLLHIREILHGNNVKTDVNTVQYS